MTADERWLRDALGAAAGSVLPPPDLATRAERTAGRIRRRWAGVAALRRGGRRRRPAADRGVPGLDRGRPPSRPAPADPCSAPESPSQPDMPADNNPAWPLRGDADLTGAADRALALWQAELEDAGEEVYGATALYAARLDPGHDDAGAVFVVAARRGMTWRASVLNFGIDGEPVEPSDNRYVNDDEVLLPRFGPRTNLSFVLQSGGSAGESNLLLVLAAPGTDRIEFTGCARTAVVTRAADGDTMQADVGPLDAPGRLRLLDGGDLRYDGAPLAARYLVTPP